MKLLAVAFLALVLLAAPLAAPQVTASECHSGPPVGCFSASYVADAVARHRPAFPVTPGAEGAVFEFGRGRVAPAGPPRGAMGARDVTAEKPPRNLAS